MRCTLVDTGPVVALLDGRDRLHRKAVAELSDAPKPRLLCPPVLVEALHLVESAGHLERLQAMVDQQVFRFEAPEWPMVAPASLAWMRRYVEHEPDFTDAFLVAWHERESGARVWTFDSEFRTTWRTATGKKLRLVGAP